MVTGTASAFEIFVQYAGVFLQLLYFLAMIVLSVVAVFAVRIYKRHVDFITGRDNGGRDEAVPVEQFVD